MKALTMHNPWALFMFLRLKTLESRKGAVLSRYTGPVAIHCSQRSPGWEEEFDRLTKAFEFDHRPGMHPKKWGPRWRSMMDGCVIGTVVVGKTQKFRPMFDNVAAVQRAACFDGDVVERYLTPISEPKWLDKPVPAKGHLWLWEWAP